MHFGLLTFFGLIFLFSGCSQQPEPLSHKVQCKSDIYAMKSAECIEKKSLVKKLEAYPVIFLGDHHDSKKVHAFTVELIDALHDDGYSVHLANEWFTSADNALLAEYADKQFNDGNFTKKIGWKKKAGYDFTLFAPIYHTVQEINGSLYGINMSKAFKKKISDQNLSGMTKEERAFYHSLDLNVTAHHQMLSEYFSHCHALKNGESRHACRDRMYRVQVAWDSMMAQESVRLAERVLKSPKDKLIVFVGAMHLVQNLGINMRFARRSDLSYVTIVPALVSEEGYEHAEADYLFLYAPSTSKKKDR